MIVPNHRVAQELAGQKSAIIRSFINSNNTEVKIVVYSNLRESLIGVERFDIVLAHGDTGETMLTEDILLILSKLR